MGTKYTDIKKELVDLIKKGNMLCQFLETNVDEDFQSHYHQWYTKAYEAVKQLIPNRIDDFKIFYKEIKKPDYLFDISDYLNGMCSSSEILPKLMQQINILDAALERFESVIYNIRSIVQADIFDSEIESAKHLLKHGYYRAAGAICGVVMEKHFMTVLINHNVVCSKKNPSINDYNEELKNSNIIPVDMWRFIQRMGDLRNLCDHNKLTEPTKENIVDLIDGTDKIIKTIM